MSSRNTVECLDHPTTDAILAARKAAGLSQAQAAAIVHRPSYRTWQDWERGRATMPPDAWELFLLKTGQHPKAMMTAR
jgi:DNA-binding transcriptional regulator YiaG